MTPLTTPHDDVRRQLDKILASTSFRTASQSSKLLRFLVEAVVEGREDLKEYTLGSEGLGRGDDFDPRIDPIARVEASRLRGRLEQYYLTEGAHDPVVIRLPKGSYVPQIESRETDSECQQRPERMPPAEVYRSENPLRWRTWAFSALALILLAGSILWIARFNSVPTAQPLVRLDVDLDQGEAIGTQVGSAAAVLSPDGRRVVYVSVGANGLPRLWIRRLDEPEPSEATELPGTEGARGPFFSPTGEWVAFWAAGKLKKIRTDGGTAVTLCDVPDLLGGTWGDGKIVGSSGRDLWVIPETGGTPKELAKDLIGSWPQFVAGSPVLLYATGMREVAAFSPGDGRRRVLIRGGTYPRYLPDPGRSGGYLLYVNSGTLFAVRFDPRRLEVEGAAAAILHDVSYSDTFGSSQFDVSQNGILIYRGEPGRGRFTVDWLTSGGERRPLLSKPDSYQWLKLSPDGSKLAFVLERGDSHDLWSYDSGRGQLTRLSSEAYDAMAPRWSPDGRFLVFGVRAKGVVVTPADGSGDQGLATRHDWLQVPSGFSPDGKHLALYQREAGPFQISIAPVQAEANTLRIGRPVPFLQTNTFQTYASFSEDGRWIAYTSLESGAYEVYVRAFPDNGSVRQVSVGGGSQGIWAGHKLFYRSNDDHIMVLMYRVESGRFIPDRPRRWSDLQAADTGVLPDFDVSADGEHVAVLMPAGRTLSNPSRPHVTFLLQFTDLLQQRLRRP